MKKQDLIDLLVLTAEQGASDLHLTAGVPPMMRLNGAIKPLTEDVLSPEDTRRLVVETLKEGQRAKLENEWQLDFALQVEDLGRYRGNACYVSGALEANFRYIPHKVADLATLGHAPLVDRWCDERAGMVLVTGASGEGKSTTLASMAQAIATRREVNIISIEDPIEFLHTPEGKKSLVNQREIGSDAHSFASALKNALRQDADVILVGELRDTDTMQTAITAAETGHLVIGTMHTNDAPTAVGRIIDAFPKEGQQFVAAQLAWSLLGVVCQYLLPQSNQTGLVLATELMVVNSGIEACIRDRRLSQIPGLIQIGHPDGMHTVDDSLIELLLADRISLMDALAHARDSNFVKEEFQKALKSQRKGWFAGMFSK